MSREEILRHLELAEGCQTAAQELFALGMLRDCLNRTYFAMFHGAKAITLSAGRRSKTHSGLIGLLRDLAVENEGISQGDLEAVARAQRMREKADYETFYQPTDEEVEVMMVAADRFIESIRAALQRH